MLWGGVQLGTVVQVPKSELQNPLWGLMLLLSAAQAKGSPVPAACATQTCASVHAPGLTCWPHGSCILSQG